MVTLGFLYKPEKPVLQKTLFTHCRSLVIECDAALIYLIRIIPWSRECRFQKTLNSLVLCQDILPLHLLAFSLYQYETGFPRLRLNRNYLPLLVAFKIKFQTSIRHQAFSSKKINYTDSKKLETCEINDMCNIKKVLSYGLQFQNGILDFRSLCMVRQASQQSTFAAKIR